MCQCCINCLYFTHLEVSEIPHPLHQGVPGQWWGSLLCRTEGSSPRARVSEGWKSREAEVKENQDAFPVTFCYTEVFDDQSPEDSWWLCQEAEGQTATGPWGAKGQSPLRHSLCQLGLTPKPSISWPSWSKYVSGLNHSGCKPGQAVGCKRRSSFPPQQGPHGWRHKIQLGPLGSLVKTDTGNDNNPYLPEYSD